MKLIKTLEVLLYLSLLATASLLFVKQSIEDYLEGKTSYSVAEESITLKDLPTVTICWPYERMVYGKDLVIDTKVAAKEEETVTLAMNQSVHSLFEIDLHLNEFWPKLPVTRCIPRSWEEAQCFKIATTYRQQIDETSKIDAQNFSMIFALKFSGFGLRDWEVSIMVTTDKNSYGLAGSRWFDGNVYCTTHLFNTGDSLKIIEVNEYINMDSTCSDESYYECLAKRFASFNFTAAVEEKIFGPECLFNTVCSPSSLPFDTNETPMCSKESDRVCAEKVLENLRENQEKYCQRTCRIEEF